MSANLSVRGGIAQAGINAVTPGPGAPATYSPSGGHTNWGWSFFIGTGFTLTSDLFMDRQAIASDYNRGGRGNGHQQTGHWEPAKRDKWARPWSFALETRQPHYRPGPWENPFIDGPQGPGGGGGRPRHVKASCPINGKPSYPGWHDDTWLDSENYSGYSDSPFDSGFFNSYRFSY